MPKAVIVFLLCGLLTVTILIPTQSAFSDDDDLLMYIPAMIAASA